MLCDFCVKINIFSPDKNISVLNDSNNVFDFGDIVLIRMGNIFDNQGRLLRADKIAKAYSRFKEDITSRIDGVYGLVIIDKVRKKAFIFHNSIPGGNYVYYFSDGINLYISSSIKNIIINHKNCEWVLDEQSAEEFIDNGYVPANRTLLFNIYKNSGGKYTVLDLKNGFASEKTASYFKDDSERKESFDEYAACFSQSVIDCARGSTAIEVSDDHSSAFTLSSISVNSMKGLTASNRVTAFCLMPKSRFSEIASVSMLCNHYSNVDLNSKQMSCDILHTLPQIVRITEGAVFDRNSFWRYEFSNMIGDYGCKNIILSDAVDELFCKDTYNRPQFALKKIKYSAETLLEKINHKKAVAPDDPYAKASCITMAQNDIFLNYRDISVFRPYYTNKVLSVIKRASSNKDSLASFHRNCVEKNIRKDAVKYIKENIKDVNLMDLFQSEAEKNDIAKIAKSSTYYKQFRRQFEDKNLLVEYLLRIIYIELFKRIFLNKNQSLMCEEDFNYSLRSFFPKLFAKK